MKIDKDTCEEILVTITRNKTRSLLTAFGVFWGIFMLVALMGGGQGMEQELRKEFEGFATNSGFIFAQKTGEAYKGFRKGRSWDLEMADVERIGKLAPIEISTPSVAQWGKTAIYEGNKYDCSVKGLYPDYEQIEHQEMAYGRFINDAWWACARPRATSTYRDRLPKPSPCPIPRCKRCTTWATPSSSCASP